MNFCHICGRKIKSGIRLDQLARKRNDVWAWDLVHDSYGNGEKFKCLTIKDEATSFCLSIYVETHIQAVDIEAKLKVLVARYGRPKAIRSDKGRELIAEALQSYMQKQGIQSASIDPGKPWQNVSNESFK